MNEESQQGKGFKLESVGQLEAEITRRRRELNAVLQEKELLEEKLAAIQAMFAKVQRKLNEQQQLVQHVSQRAFLLMSDLERLLGIQERIKERAAAIARQEKSDIRQEGRVAESLEEFTDPLSGQTRRSSQRALLAVDISVTSENNFYVGFSENIASGGIFVATYQPLPVGKRLMVEFRLPTSDEPIHSLVEVAWSTEYQPEAAADSLQPGMGLRFIAIDPIDQERVAEFLRQRQPLLFPDVDDLVS